MRLSRDKVNRLAHSVADALATLTTSNSLKIRTPSAWKRAAFLRSYSRQKRRSMWCARKD